MNTWFPTHFSCGIGTGKLMLLHVSCLLVNWIVQGKRCRMRRVWWHRVMGALTFARGRRTTSSWRAAGCTTIARPAIPSHGCRLSFISLASARLESFWILINIHRHIITLHADAGCTSASHSPRAMNCDLVRHGHTYGMWIMFVSSESDFVDYYLLIMSEGELLSSDHVHSHRRTFVHLPI